MGHLWDNNRQLLHSEAPTCCHLGGLDKSSLASMPALMLSFLLSLVRKAKNFLEDRHE